MIFFFLALSFVRIRIWDVALYRQWVYLKQRGASPAQLTWVRREDPPVGGEARVQGATPLGGSDSAPPGSAFHSTSHESFPLILGTITIKRDTLGEFSQGKQSPSPSLVLHHLWRRKWQPTPAFVPGKPHGQRSLVGCSPWGLKESDTTEQLKSSISYTTLLLLQYLMFPVCQDQIYFPK